MKYIIAAWLCLYLQQVHAQVRTIIPAEKMETIVYGTRPGDYDIYTARNDSTITSITFNLSSLPDQAIIDSVVLRLVIDEETETVRLAGQATHDRTGIAIRNKNKGLYRKGDEVMLATDNRHLFARLITEAKNNGKTITIRVSTQLEDKRYKIYNTTRYGAGTDPGKVPRLIIDYRPELRRVAWGGYLSDAQHTASGMATFAEGDRPTDLKSKKIADKQDIKGLVFNDDQLLFTDQTQGSTILYAMDPVTGRITALNTRLTPPAFRPLISRDGYYYHIANNGIFRIKLSDLSTKQALLINVSSAPVLGRNGALYLATDSFVRAYAPPPLYTLLWRYSIGKTRTNEIDISPVTLSNDDSLVYIIYGERGDRMSYLVAINTISKKADTVKLEMGLKSTSMPVIAVNNSDYLYFINGRTDGDTLYIFDKHLRNKTTICHYTHISHPAVSNNNVYVVAGRKLLQIRGYQLADSMDTGLPRADQVITDKDDNVYILSGSKLSLCSFKGSGPYQPVVRDLADPSEFYNLVIAPDGSVYTNTNREIFAFRPSGFSKQHDTLSNLSLRHNTTYRANTLSIKAGDTVRECSGNVFIGNTDILIQPNVRFESSTDNTFESGGATRIAPGFRVEQGARLSFKTGY